MTAVVRVGIDPASLELELFQPICLDHQPPWTGAETFDLDTAKTNARVHNTDRHPGPLPDHTRPRRLDRPGAARP